jgi:hypothetical protein
MARRFALGNILDGLIRELVLFAAPCYAQTATLNEAVAQGEATAAISTRDARVTSRRART